MKLRSLGILLFFFNVATAAALDTARMELAVPVPNPATAGGDISFQGIAINNGSEEWAKESYYWEAHVFGADKKYIVKTERLVGPSNLKPGESTTASISFSLPPNFSGAYYFRLFLIHGEIRTAESDYTAFQVTARAQMETQEPKKLPIGGSLIVAYQNSNIAAPRDGQWSTVLNVIGQSGQGAYLLNSYNIHDSTTPLNPYIILGSYHREGGSASLGDVSPNFTPLTLASQGMRGLELKIQPQRPDLKNSDWSLVIGRTVPAQTGSASSNGRYERLIYSGFGSRQWWDSKAKISAAIMLGLDNTGSLSSDPESPMFRGSTLRPQDNQVLGLSFNLKPKNNLNLDFDLAQSVFRDNVESPNPVNGTSVRFEASQQFEKSSLKASLLRASPQFLSFGASSIAPDRITYALDASWQPMTQASLSGSFNQYSDNLAQDPKKTTSIQRTLALNPSLNLPSQTQLTAGWSQNTAQANPRVTLNNVSQTHSLGISQVWKKQNFSASFQNSQFRDLNGLAHNLDTNALALSANLIFSGRWRLVLGNTNSITKDKADGHHSENASQSASVHYTVIPDRLSTQVWGTGSTSKDNSAASPSESRNWTANAEMTWQVCPELATTAGLNQSQKEDVLNGFASGQMGISARITWSFDAFHKPCLPKRQPRPPKPPKPPKPEKPKKLLTPEVLPEAPLTSTAPVAAAPLRTTQGTLIETPVSKTFQQERASLQPPPITITPATSLGQKINFSMFTTVLIFPPHSARVAPSNFFLLMQAADYLWNNPDCAAFIVGYSDDPESERMGLALKRAQNIKKFLTEEATEISKKRLKILIGAQPLGAKPVSGKAEIQICPKP
ncbi:MAG: hypothetical protein HY547_03620 [Elusimicrobia bacterium]|nr:hypothetical protein [Elusimicrobiota bacterium]